MNIKETKEMEKMVDEVRSTLFEVTKSLIRLGEIKRTPTPRHNSEHMQKRADAIEELKFQIEGGVHNSINKLKEANEQLLVVS